jgi:hypothetical protein
VDRFSKQAEAFIETLHGMIPPNDAAHRFVLSLAVAFEQFKKTRDHLRFEDEPGGFETALLATKEPT